jgi:hypothetical protein
MLVTERLLVPVFDMVKVWFDGLPTATLLKLKVEAGEIETIGTAVNVAVTDESALIVKVHKPVPVHEAEPVPPDQPPKAEPVPALALMVTAVPGSYVLEHGYAEQLRPFVPVTVPLPTPDLFIVKVYWLLNVAVTFLTASIVTVHVPVPEHPSPNHPAKVEFAPAVAVRVTDVPESYE